MTSSKLEEKHIMYLKKSLGVIFICVLAGSIAVAQVPLAGSVAPMDGPKVGMVTVTAHVDDMDVEPAKGAPFCATVTTEHTQTFADGNRIHTSDSSGVCRDGEGRTRREASLNLLGAAAQTSVPKLITIVDPVAGYRYMLDSKSKTAHRIPISPKMTGPKAELRGVPEKGQRVMIYQNVRTGGPNMSVAGDVVFKSVKQPSDEPAPATENLGDQTIEGIHTTGTRMTTTIPAGRMGNEQPIAVTSERWYSPELKATILTKHTDPWAGELKSQFTNVNTSEPDSSLFHVPGDYKIVDEKAGPLQKRVLAPPAPPQ